MVTVLDIGDRPTTRPSSRKRLLNLHSIPNPVIKNSTVV